MIRRMIAPLLIGVIGVAILVSLGTWQLRRLEWKTAIIAEIDARLAAPPVAVPAAPDAATQRYLRVSAEGTLLPGELHVYTSVPPFGVGYRVIQGLALGDGRRILLDRGFIPIGEKDAVRPVGPIVVEGSLVWPDETDSFTDAPDRVKNIWFARDLPIMADALGTEPVMIAVAKSSVGGPRPLPVTVAIRNDHLQYAITWFGLAIVWTLMTVLWLWRIKRPID